MKIKAALFVAVVFGADITDRPTLPRQMELAKVFAVNMSLVDERLLV